MSAMGSPLSRTTPIRWRSSTACPFTEQAPPTTWPSSCAAASSSASSGGRRPDLPPGHWRAIRDPLRLTVYIRLVDRMNPKPLSTTLHFFDWAAKAAGGYMRELPLRWDPRDLGELIDQLSSESPELEQIAVPSYLVNERSARLD